MFYSNIIRPLLFALTRKDPEQAHEMTIALLRFWSKSKTLCSLLESLYTVHDRSLETELWGIKFPNPVGLAGGFDKNAVALPALSALGFGFIEAGTVTLKAQPGNPRPRIFRIPNSRAIINRMGFNNDGANAMAEMLDKVWPIGVPIGISIGKNKNTLEEKVTEDYCKVLELMYPRLDYFAVNISSPNTPGLRDLQNRKNLDHLLKQLQLTVTKLCKDTNKKLPLLVKIAPDLSEKQIVQLLEVCDEHSVAGVIATNTTIDRNGLKGADRTIADEVGGLSGRPLRGRSREAVAFIHKETSGRLPIIGVGGIQSADDALKMMDAGASLVQVYTGLIYEGPALIKKINRALALRR